MSDDPLSNWVVMEFSPDFGGGEKCLMMSDCPMSGAMSGKMVEVVPKHPNFGFIDLAHFSGRVNHFRYAYARARRGTSRSSKAVGTIAPGPFGKTRWVPASAFPVVCGRSVAAMTAAKGAVLLAYHALIARAPVGALRDHAMVRNAGSRGGDCAGRDKRGDDSDGPKFQHDVRLSRLWGDEVLTGRLRLV